MFKQARFVGKVTSSVITEVSGLAASRRHNDVLYTHNDSGGKSRIFAIDATSGQRRATITISGAESVDWEDIAAGPCPGGQGHCIYIGDIGGNSGRRADTIYRVQEPDELQDEMTIALDSFLKFRYDALFILDPSLTIAMESFLKVRYDA
jgi:hypothetical protein